MRLSVILFIGVAAAIGLAWAWLGAAVPMPASPLGEDEKLYCVSYAPFRGGQTPLNSSIHIDAAQIEEDLAKLAGRTRCVRTYATEHGLDQVAGIAAKHGLKVLQGLWLSRESLKNQQEIDRVVALTQRYRDTISGIVVGNEVLLRGEMTGTDLAATIGRVKAAVPVPVTYADVWEFWLRHPEVYAAVDFVTIHILPYWEDFPIPAPQAGAHLEAIRAKVAAAYPGKDILIGETGWPSAGRMREGAEPSPSNQALVAHAVLSAASRGGYRVNLIEAFDQPWKRALEGTVGGYWGLNDDRRREPKFSWGAPVSDHPRWVAQAMAGILLAALIFVAASRAQPPDRAPPVADWIAVGAIAGIAGFFLGWTVEKAIVESFGAAGWLRNVLLIGLALLTPVLSAMGVMRGGAPPSFAAVLGGVGPRPQETSVLLLGAGLIAAVLFALQAALGLVFDPRYRDLPFAAFGAVAGSFAVLAVRVPRNQVHSDAGLAERVAAGVLALCAGYVALNEGLANWQAIGVAAAWLALAASLLRFAGARGRSRAAQLP